MSVSSGGYSPSYVPTVFVEQTAPPPPPPPPSPPKQEGGLLISRGFLVVVAILLFGALVASTGGLYWLYKGESQKLETATGLLEAEKKKVAAADKTLAEQKISIEASTKTIQAYRLDYGKIEQLQSDARDLQKKIEEVLARRPGTPGLPDRLKQPPLWREAGEQTLAKYVADLDREFKRIDKPVVVQQPVAGPSVPVIR